MSNFSYRGLREDSEQVFFPFFEGDGASGTFYVKVHGKPESFVPSLRAIVHGVDPTLAMTDFRTVSGTGRSIAEMSSTCWRHCLSSFGSACAIVLSLVGLCGVMSFVVTRCTREIGIRLRLGATAIGR